MKNKIPKVKHYQLENGLRIHLIKRPEFHQIVSLLTVDYGARDIFVDNKVTLESSLNNKLGIAHFLEHQLFKQPSYDAMVKINKLGDIVNAYTTATRTSYFTVSLAYQYQSLKELLTFTQEPYFNNVSVEQEADIIEQEIDMYKDDPTAQLYQAILGQIYPKDLLSYDIAGTVESIHDINTTDLEEIFNIAYRSDNMDLVVVGAFDEYSVKNLIENSSAGIRKNFGQRKQMSIAKNIDKRVDEDTRYLKANINRSRIAVGQRISLPQSTGRKGLKNVLALDLGLNLIFSESSPNYRAWYDIGLIDESFSVELTCERNLSYLVIFSETSDPEKLINVLKKELQHLDERIEFLYFEFEVIKRGAIGRLINKFNSLEEWAMKFDGLLFEEAFLSDELMVLQSLTFKDVQLIVQQTQMSEIASVIIKPEL